MPPPQPDEPESGRMEALAARLQPKLAEQLRAVVTDSASLCCCVLEAAASMGRHEALREILKIYDTAAPDTRSDLRAATLAAACMGHPQCLQLLLDSCTSSPSSLTELLDATDVEECTPLLKSALGGHVECMRLLLEHSPEAQVAAKDADGRTALMHAAFNGQAACIHLLLAHSPLAQVAAVNREGDGALLHSAVGGHAACMELLLAHSPDAQAAAVSVDGVNALMIAAGNGHTSCVQLLLAHSPDVQVAALAASPAQQQLDMALLVAGQRMSELQAPPADEQLRLRFSKCIELLLASGAMPTAQASEGAIAAIRPINRGLAARALVPDMANEAVVGLALAAGRRRQARGEDAAGPS